MFFAVLIIISKLTIAAEELPPQTIKQFSTGWGAEGFYVWTNENVIGDGCPTAVLRLRPDHPMRSEIVSFLLSAFHSGSNVSIYVNGCIGNQMKLEAVRLTN
jgi:hypothetical protein